MLHALMLLAATTAVQVPSGPGWDDPTDLGRVGPWDLRCVRDGSFTSWNHEGFDRIERLAELVAGDDRVG